MAAPTTITPRSTVGGYITAGQTVTETAMDSTNGNRIPLTGVEIVRVRNSATAASLTHSVIFTGIADARNNLTPGITETISGGVVKEYGPFPLAGWNNGGFLLVTGDHAALLCDAIRPS